MRQRQGTTKGDLWRWEAARLRDRATHASDPATREQLLVFAEDCDEEARHRDDDDGAGWRGA